MVATLSHFPSCGLHNKHILLFIFCLHCAEWLSHLDVMHSYNSSGSNPHIRTSLTAYRATQCCLMEQPKEAAVSLPLATQVFLKDGQMASIDINVMLHMLQRMEMNRQMKEHRRDNKERHQSRRARSSGTFGARAILQRRLRSLRNHQKSTWYSTNKVEREPSFLVHYRHR